MVVQRYLATVPIDVVMNAIQELDEGSRFVVETCIRSNKAQCLTAGEESSCTCKKLKVHELQKFALLSMQQIVSVVLLSSNFSAPSAGELEEVLKSLAWQSPSLAQYFAHQNMRFRLMAGGNFERENELLSEGDIADLLAGA
jgi:hypothetical protein